MTKCAVVSCRGEYTGGTVNGSAAGFTLCDAHWRAWVARPWARLGEWPPCGVERVMADWLRLADAELRNGTTNEEAK